VKRRGQSRLEWGLLALTGLVCVVLSALQYRWTSEFSRAEQVRMRWSLNEQVRLLAREFDSDLRESCRALLPDALELERGLETAHRNRYERWAAEHPPELFSRIAVAAPEGPALRLYQVDREGGLRPAEWPAEWRRFQESMSARLRGEGPPPATPLGSALIEIPVFGGRGGPGPEREWMIFEVNLNRVRAVTMPRLVSTYLNPEGAEAWDVSLSWSGGGVIWSSRADGVDVAAGADATVSIFPVDVGAFGRRLGRPGNDPPAGRWTLSVRNRSGSVDAAVARARRRSLVVSMLLIGLLGGVAWALVHYTARSRRLAEVQFQFAAGVSHDLRTPLTAIRGAAFSLADGVVNDAASVKRYARLIQRNAEELTSMVENVLAYSASRHATPAPPEKRRAVNIRDTLEHAVRGLAAELDSSGCQLELHIAPGLPDVSGDKLALERTLQNLIGNALRHARQGRWVGVSASAIGESVEVRVNDRGPGIPAAELGRIFEPFYRGEQARAGRVRGTGLGLSMVRETVEQHGGTVTVLSAPEEGTQFVVRLPAMGCST
jgi:signal transduction histidine kinase